MRGVATRLERRRGARPPAILTALALVSGLAVGAATAPGAGEQLEIVRRAVEHHGGERYRHSETSLELCSRSGCYQMTVWTDGGRYRHEVSGPYRGENRIVKVDNDSVALSYGGEPEAVAPEARQALRDWAMARVYFAFLPYRLADPAVRHQDLGIEEWHGRRLHKVKVTFVAGSSTAADDEYLYWFDPDSGRLEQFAYSFGGDPGGLRFRRLRDYRRVGGILFFDQENLGVEGPGLRVDEIVPDFVSRRMRRVSRVELKNINVRPLAE